MNILKSNSQSEIVLHYIPYFTYTLLALIALNNCFFFDTIILASTQALFYFQTNFSSLLLPDAINSGHPPLMGVMLAGMWKIFGLKMWVAHFFIWLWSMLLIYQSQLLMRKFFDLKFSYLVVIALLFDATFLSQSILVSPDIVLIACFVTAIRFILEEKKILLSVVLIVLSLISMRGTASVFALFIFHLYLTGFDKIDKRLFVKWLKILILYLPGVLLFIAFFGYHYFEKGWVVFHADSPWAGSFQKVTSISQTGRNFCFFGWRFIDFGRLIIWAGILLVALSLKNKKLLRWNTFTRQEQAFGVLVSILILFYTYSAVLHVSLSAHRYFMPAYFLFTLMMFLGMKRVWNERKRVIFAVGTTACLLAGNFIAYPEKISTGWDATLGHLPFYELRNQMIDYIEQHNLSTRTISGTMSFDGNQYRIDLKNRQLDFPSVLGTDGLKSDYVIYTNVANLPDEMIDELTHSGHWLLEKKLAKGSVFISLYKKNDTRK